MEDKEIEVKKTVPSIRRIFSFLTDIDKFTVGGIHTMRIDGYNTELYITKIEDTVSPVYGPVKKVTGFYEYDLPRKETP
jgi:hypothetical protein